MDAIFYKWIRAKIQAELTEGVSLKDAYIDLAFMPELRLRAGQFHVPFSLEEFETSDNYIDFIERSMINELAPMRDRGVKIYGDLLWTGSSIITWAVSTALARIPLTTMATRIWLSGSSIRRSEPPIVLA